MADLKHDRDFDPQHGEAVRISDAVRRITARNANPFTWHGTNSYLIGRDEVAVLDPGPMDEAHVELLLAEAGPAPVTAILVSHTHKDHSPGARLMKERTGAPIIGCGPHRPARPLGEGEINPLDASSDEDYHPDRVLKDGEAIEVDGLRLTAVATPGHTANHLCFALDYDDTLFSADHVMAWSTTIVAPPDGSMSAYMASLDKLEARSDRQYLPGHGGPVRDPATYLAGLKVHRQTRERAILAELADGPQTVTELVARIYRGLDPRLRPAAALSVLAQLEFLVEQHQVSGDGPLAPSTRYRRR
ncbi:MBL fold metallo-hydrolase [Stappia indica]|uniref:MBL fold metallo-hydrolase n=1 Tax=Stappia indica TaxID=538381 RepID=UPI001CD64B10|nr:MBL fold metallo-hydrolase [Stappia indica]MCA1297889.1 MBL fold metallo-hydrolase [Stappia indica]